MNKKASFFAGVIFIGVAVLVFFGIRSFKFPSPGQGETTAEILSSEASDVTSAVDLQQNTDAAEEVTEAPLSAGESVFSDEIRSARFTVAKVEDAISSEEVSGRVALGSSYSDCYLSFDDDSGFEILLSSSSGTREGDYELYDDIIGITYSDGKGAEFRILSEDQSTVSYIVVSYGAYNVYFAK